MAACVAAVPNRSPLRYPGGKTWLIPHIREWLLQTTGPKSLLIEPFAGGATASLTAVMEGYCKSAFMVEWDLDIAAFWEAALLHSEELIDRIRRFDCTVERVDELFRQEPETVVDHGFRSLVLNRAAYGGITTRRAGRIKDVAARWYPNTLIKRLDDIARVGKKLRFFSGDGMRIIKSRRFDRASVSWFIDPPYTVDGGKSAGTRLYAKSEIDYGALFARLADSNMNFLMTYDVSEEIIDIIDRYKFYAVTVQMKGNTHKVKSELIITRNQVFA